MLGRYLGAAALMAYLWAWLLPSLVTHVLFEEWRFSGWEATLVALSPIVPGHFGLDTGWSEWPFALLAVGSGMTNVLFLAALVLALRWPQRVNSRWEGAIWIAALLNTHWFAQSDFRHELRSGYYMWLFSYVLLASALHATRRACARAALDHAAA